MGGVRAVRERRGEAARRVRSALSDGEILGDCDNDGFADSVDNCPSVIPAGATVVSAHATVTEQWNQSVTTVRAHQVVNPWNELTVNWPNFGSTSNFDPTAIASFTTGNDGGPKTFDITALAVDWVSGNADNNGILLEEDLAGTPTLHAYAASESPLRTWAPDVHEGRDGRQPRRERPPRRRRQPSQGPSNYNRLRNPCWRRGRCATRRCAPHRLVKQVDKGARRIGKFPPRARQRHSAEPCHDGRPDMPASWSASLQACRTCPQRGPESLSPMSDMPATRSGVVVSDVGHARDEVRSRCQRCRTCPQRGPESLSAMSDMPATRSGGG